MRKNQQSGFTLIELSIVVLVFGTIVGTMGYALTQYVKYQNRKQTAESIQLSSAALIEGKILGSFYLCPARYTANLNDADYGVANCAAALRGISQRDADGDNVLDNVLIGAIPFRTLAALGVSGSVTASDTIDGYGNKLTYAVSEYLAYDPTTAPVSAFTPEATNAAAPKGQFDPKLGAIDVIDEFGTSTLQAPFTAQFVVISHGENGKGAYSRDGQLTEVCTSSFTDPGTGQPAVPSTTTPDPDDTENCDNNDARFLSALRSQRNSTYFDDRIQVTNINDSTLWNFTSKQLIAPGVELDRIVPTSPGRLGMGTDQPDEKIHVVGDILVNTAIADNFCNKNGEECMSAESIAGDDPNMECPGVNQAVRIVSQSTFTCVSVQSGIITSGSPSSIKSSCQAGYAMCGLSNTSGVLCREQNNPSGPCT